MKKVLILEASPRSGWSAKAARMLEGLLTGKNIEVKTAALREEAIGYCRGCGVCIGKGEGYCPMHEDAAQKLLEEMLRADGVIIVTPNYALQVPGLLKNLLDRLSFVFHRPRLFGRVFMSVVISGVYGGPKINKYLNETMEFWGFRPVKGASIPGALYPNEQRSEETEEKSRQKITEAAARFIKALNSQKPRTPSFFRVAIFRATRTSMKHFDAALAPDRAHYEKNGWFDSAYYYSVALGPFKSLFGAFVDGVMKRMAKKERKRKSAGLEK
ncbi:MAG: flavodoxin family protein [Bacillota bacterium]